MTVAQNVRASIVKFRKTALDMMNNHWYGAVVDNRFIVAHTASDGDETFSLKAFDDDVTPDDAEREWLAIQRARQAQIAASNVGRRRK